MGGFVLYVDGEPYHTLSPDQLLDLIHSGSIDVPILTAEQICDKSKGNAISKGLIILQVTWFIMQLISRAIYHLETTQLELGTLAFAVLNFITYAAWWNKPLDVQRPGIPMFDVLRHSTCHSLGTYVHYFKQSSSSRTCRPRSSHLCLLVVEDEAMDCFV